MTTINVSVGQLSPPIMATVSMDGTELLRFAMSVGLPGKNGWTPVPSIVVDGARAVLFIDWAGGQGTKPQTGYVSNSGLTDVIADATDVRGIQGIPGPAIPVIPEVHAQTYADIPDISGRAFVSVVADETNDGLSSLYYHDESGLHWIPLV